MTPFRALKLALPRPATQGGLRPARASIRPAANTGRTRLMAVQSVNSLRGALHVLRHQRGTRLPIDVLTTHYPTRRGRVLLNVVLGPLSRCGLPPDRNSPGQRRQDVLGRCVAANLAQQSRNALGAWRTGSRVCSPTTAPMKSWSVRPESSTAGITTASRQRC